MKADGVAFRVADHRNITMLSDGGAGKQDLSPSPLDSADHFIQFPCAVQVDSGSCVRRFQIGIHDDGATDARPVRWKDPVRESLEVGALQRRPEN